MNVKLLLGLFFIGLMVLGAFEVTNAQVLSGHPFPPSYSSLPWITVSGTHFAYDNGTYVLLHGADYSGAEFGTFTFTSRDFQAMASWGFNVVRMPIAWSYVEPSPGVYSQSYIDRVKQAVALANRYGIYVIIDMHQWWWSPVFDNGEGNGLPPWAVPYRGGESALEKDEAYFWSNLTVEQDFASMWEYVASQFANDSGVLGYDLFNEPTTPTNWTSQQMYQNMARVYDMAISAIRKVDQRHIIFFETSGYDQGTHPSNWVEPVDPAHKLAIEVHDYWSNPLSAPLYAVLQASQEWDIPVYDGEFGADLNSPLQATMVFNEYGIAWTYWSYCWEAEAGAITYEKNPLLGVLDEAYPRLSSVPVSSFSIENVTYQGITVSEVIVNATFAGKSGWADFFIPEGFNVTSPSGAFSASSRTFNVTFDDGSVSLRLSPPPGYGFAGALFTIAEAPSAPAAGLPFNVSAWVYSSEGLPVRDAAVLLLINGKQVASSTTNSQGMAQFTATVAQPGNCSLAVELKQYPFVYGNRTIQVLPPPSISLEAPSTVPVGHQASLTASVSSQGSPISGISVSFYANGTPIGTAITNSSGLASLAYVPRSVGTTSLTASLSSYPSISASATMGVMPVTAVKEQLSLAVPSTATVGQSVTLTAKVKYANGTPVKGVAVTFYANGTQIGTSTTGEQGTASLTYAFSRKGLATLSASTDGLTSRATVSVQETSFSPELYILLAILVAVMVIGVYLALRHAMRSKPTRCGGTIGSNASAWLPDINAFP
ncbi:cellulase family glycosylhydrolase [Tardisphaera miroshnichenkoae]